MGLVWEARSQFVAQIDSRELERCYINYLQAVFDQDYILHWKNEEEMLMDALQRLPKLTAIEYLVPSQKGTSLSCCVPPLDALNARTRRILAAPEDYHGYQHSEKHFWALL